MQYIESEIILLKSRNLAESFFNFDMSSYNKEHMDSNKQNCKYIVLFIKKTSELPVSVSLSAV